MLRRATTYFISAAILLAGASALLAQTPAPGTPAPGQSTVWKGVYTEAQAARGLDYYKGTCNACHKEDLLGFDDSDGFAAQLRGEMFMEHWQEDSLQALFTRMKTSMPPGAAGSITDAEYTDVLAYILKENDIPAGQQELKQADLSGIRLTVKDGSGQIPDGALVEINGCMLQSRQKAWIVYKASDPVRVRDTERPAEDALKAIAAAPLGARTFRLKDADFLKLQTRLNRKVVVRGFLTWKTNDDQLSVVSIEQAGSAVCQ